MMPVHVSDGFTWNVTVGFVLMWLGAALGTVVSVWREGAAFRTGMERRAGAFPARGAAAMSSRRRTVRPRTSAPSTRSSRSANLLKR